MANRRRSFWIPILLVAVIFSVTFVVNFAMLSTQVAPAGADYGNYLIQVNILRGDDLRGWGLRHQPVFFVLLDFFLYIFDTLVALKVAAAFVFSIIAVPFFVLTKKLSGNDYAAAVATGLFSFFVTYTEMIAWGGNPNFLAFSFLLLTMIFVMDFMKQPSKKNIVLIGLFLSLTIGTHILVAIFAFASLLLFVFLRFLFVRPSREQVRGNLKNLIYVLLSVAVFSLPYVSYYLTFFRNSSSELVGFRLFDVQLAFGSPIDVLWVTIPTFFFAGVIGIVGLFGLSKYLKENKTNALLISSLLLTPFVLVVATAQPIRWIYFLPIPFLLCFAIFLGKLFPDVKNAKKTTIMLFTALFIVSIAMSSTRLAGAHFAEASQFYSFIGKDEIEAMNWIRDSTPQNAIIATSGHVNDVGGGGNSYAWWVEGYSNRICMFTGDLEYFSFQFERDNVRTTNRIFRGTYSLEYGNLKVVEGFPSSNDNPTIATFVKNDFENLFVTNDGQNYLLYSPTEDNQTLSVSAIYSQNPENRTSVISYDENMANITITYELPNFEVARSVIVDSNSSVDIIYHVLPVNSTLRLFKVNLWSLFESSLQDCKMDENNVVSLLHAFSGENVTTKINVVETNGKVANTKVIFPDLRKSNAVVNYEFEPTENNDLSVHIKVNIESIQYPSTESKLIFYSSYGLVKDLKVDYLMVNKFRNEYLRFLYDPQNYHIEFENYAIAIFKVNY